jgi:hypothetical protein
VWGFLGDAPDDLVAVRRPLFEGAADIHNYLERRRIVDAVPESALRKTPAQVRDEHRSNWRALLNLES